VPGHQRPRPTIAANHDPLRTLDACGGSALLLMNGRTRLSHPKVFRGGRGMSLRVPVLDLERPEVAIDWLRDRGLSIYLATVGPEALLYHEVAVSGRTALVVGNERYGISRPWLASGLPRIMLLMRGRADSVNVAVSASILLHSVPSSALTVEPGLTG
jgi:TrmH family RNA methyltransferase